MVFRTDVFISHEQQMKAFQMSAFFKMGNNPKELNHDEPFCKSTYPNRKALCECSVLLAFSG